MQTFFIYLIESSLILGILFFLYKQLFYKETYFEWNRIYLLVIVGISLIIPLVKLPYHLMTNIDYSIFESANAIDIENSDNVLAHVFLQKKQQNAYQFILIVIGILKVLYFIGILFFSFNFFKNLFQILRLKRLSKLVEDMVFKVYETNQNTETFSFFKNIFLSSTFENLSKKEQKQVLQHEKIHASQLHSLDVLVLEIIKIIFWFNPIIWNLKLKIKEIHEYIVDANIVTENLPSEYSQLILKLSINNFKNVLQTSFADTKVKDRILMLANKESQKLKKRKFLIGLPLLIFVILSFGFTKSIFLDTGIKYTYNYKEFSSAVPENVSIVTPFFTDKYILKKEKKEQRWQEVKYKVSHTEITYNSYSNMPVKSIGDGVVSAIKKTENWGVEEFEVVIKHNNNFTSIYKKLSEVRVGEKDKLLEGDTLAIMGDDRIFQVIELKLLKGKKAVNPLIYIK